MSLLEISMTQTAHFALTRTEPAAHTTLSDNHWTGWGLVLRLSQRFMWLKAGPETQESVVWLRDGLEAAKNIESCVYMGSV